MILIKEFQTDLSFFLVNTNNSSKVSLYKLEIAEKLVYRRETKDELLLRISRHLASILRTLRSS